MLGLNDLFHAFHHWLIYLGLVDVGRTASTAAGSEAIVARVVHSGPTSFTLELLRLDSAWK